MDVFAHTLWTNAGARAANAVASKEGKKFHISPGWAAFWGVFPDLFAFSIPFIIRFYSVFLGGKTFSVVFAKPNITEGGIPEGFQLAHYLYNYSHSLVIWAVVFMIVWFVYKRPRYELQWAFHILIDIPSHVLTFFPTPFLFPISNYYFPYGIQWSNQWYMMINYGLLFIVWGKIALSKIKVI